MRGGRLLLVLSSGARGRMPGLVHGRSASGKSYYFEPLDVVEDNNQLATCVEEQEAERRRLLAELLAAFSAELPLLVDMINAGQVPEGVSVVGLATAIDELRPNYPPSSWFDREGWQQPTLIDDANSDGLHALGLSVFPGFVFVDAQGRVTQRMTGEVPVPALIQAMEAAAGG